MQKETLALIVMGVSGSGKTTVGELVAERLGWKFYDADDFHPRANVEKMASGRPLNDNDRRPWLLRLQRLISEHINNDEPMVLACSALKQSYRHLLKEGNEATAVVYLKGSFDLIFERMNDREDHYMKADMLKSQFDALEEPTDALVVDIDQTPEAIAGQVVRQVRS